ncbi:MAG: hypothetical protein ACKO85_13195 [Isosphaeraceae bacterium]
MTDRTEKETYIAEVIDMDAHASHDEKVRPSARFTHRIDGSAGIAADDPAARFLFYDRRQARRRQGRKAKMRRARDFVLTFAMGMAGAWIVWFIPGYGPLERQNQLLQAIVMQQSQIQNLDRQIAQAQTRTAELTKLAEINRDLVDQGELARRALAQRLDRASEANRNLQNELSSSREKMAELASLVAGNADFARQQVDRVNRLSSKMTKVENELKASQGRTQTELAVLGSSISKLKRDEVSRDEILELRARVERLAGHVWQEVGRLDGRIVRASTESSEKVIR